MTKFDLHIHSNNSDGSDTVFELSEIIKKEKIEIFALTDHDTVDGCFEMQKYFDKGFICGVELTCLLDVIKCHILGYFVDINNEGLKKLIEEGKILRRKKLETRIKYLKDVHNFEFTIDELNWLYSRHSVVKTHLANILVKRGLAPDNISAMKKYLDGCKTGNTRFDGIKAIQTIKNAGGIPIWAHPLGGEGESHISKEEFLLKLDTMIQNGIMGLECYYSRYNQDEINFLLSCAKKYNLKTTGGSDYHGSNKTVKIAKLNVENTPVDFEQLNFNL